MGRHLRVSWYQKPRVVTCLERFISASEQVRSHQFAAGSWRARSTRTPILVRDPLSTWGGTASMGVPQLLDALDRAERAQTGRNKLLWERLSCRAQALAPDFSAPDLCRALFAFSRARHRDDGLLRAASEALLIEHPDQELTGNDVALLLKAFSKHGFVHLETIDFLLRRIFSVEQQSLTPADISQILSAVLRLGLSQRLADDGPHHGLLDRLYATACHQLGDAYLPAGDMTNLCAAAALYHPSQGGGRFLEDASLHLLSSPGRLMTTPPADIVRRLLSVTEFDKAVCLQGKSSLLPVADRLGQPRVLKLCQVTACALARRAHELDVRTAVAACEVMVALLPAAGAGAMSSPTAGPSWDHSVLRPVFALVHQRLPSMSESLMQRATEALAALAEVQPDPLLLELLDTIPCTGSLETSPASVAQRAEA